MDSTGEGVEWESVMRIRVIIDIQKPLERGRCLTIAGKTHWVSFKYENLPVFCFNCGRIAHGEEGCQVRLRSNQKEWGVWLRAEKFGRQGLNRGTGRQPSGSFQRPYSDNSSMGGKVQTKKAGSVIGGNPTANHHLYEVSANNNLNIAKALPKIAVGIAIAGNNGDTPLTGLEGFSVASQGNEYHGSGMGVMAQSEIKGDSGQTYGAQQGVTGQCLGPIRSASLCGDLLAQCNKEARFLEAVSHTEILND